MDGERAGVHVADGVDQAHHPAGSAHVQAGQGTGLTAVSYTHLDVYKRQAP